MNQKIEGLNKKTLKKVFKLLKKDTKNFSTLLVRDPLDYLDFEVTLDETVGMIAYEINSGNYNPQRPRLHLSAKGKGINRPTVVFDVKDALVYRFCIQQIEDELLEKTRQKKNNVKGGIKIAPNRTESGDEWYEKYFKDWMEHQNNLKRALLHSEYLVTTDIASYFENVNILVLKDLVRSDVEGKNGVLNLLFYFLENTRFRHHYEVNTFNGLPQENTDCSRTLAYYFLKSNDEEMAAFCKENKESGAEFYRYVDDMSITVDSEVTGRKALKRMTESLRKLNLVASIEKTAILTKAEAWSELFFQENDYLSAIEESLLSKLKERQTVETEIQKLESYYSKLIEAKRDNCKNWIKILKRFYTLCIYAKSDLLMKEIREHVIKYPTLFSDTKIAKYLIMNQDKDDFKETLTSLINYLYSEENLYPAIESNLLETFLFINFDSLGTDIICRLRGLCNDVFFKKSGYKPLSDYARAIACLMFYRFDDKNIETVANHYLKRLENDYMLRKYMIFISLAVKNKNLRQKVLNKARTEQSPSINRLVNFVDDIGKYKNQRIVRDFLKRNELNICYKPAALFSVAVEAQSDLNDSTVSKDLRQEFKDNDISLSDDASVSAKKTDTEWLITDWDKTYLIKKHKSKLSIYLGDKPEDDFEILETYKPVRIEILKELIDIYDAGQ